MCTYGYAYAFSSLVPVEIHHAVVGIRHNVLESFKLNVESWYAGFIAGVSYQSRKYQLGNTRSLSQRMEVSIQKNIYLF